MSPEKLHLALNHLPLIGVGFSVIPLVIGLIARSRVTLAAGFMMALLGAGPIYFVMETGEQAHDWMYTDAGMDAIDDDGMLWAHEHEERAELAARTIYTAAGLALVGLVLTIPRGLGKTRMVVGVLAAVVCAACVPASIWVADAGGKIHHPELRTGPPPAAASRESHAAEHGEHGEHGEDASH